MEYNSTYNNNDCTITFRISGQIEETKSEFIKKIIDFHMHKVETTYDLEDSILKLNNLFRLFKDNCIVLNFNNTKESLVLKYQDNKLVYYFKSRNINEKHLEIKYQDNKFNIVTPNSDTFKTGEEQEDYKEIAKLILEEIDSYENLKEIKESKQIVSERVKNFYYLYKLFYKKNPSFLDEKLYQKATAMYYIIYIILGKDIFSNEYFQKDNRIANFEIELLVYEFLELIYFDFNNLDKDNINIDKRVEIIGDKIGQYIFDTSTLLDFCNYLYYRSINQDIENIEFEHLLKDINDDLDSYKGNSKRKYLTVLK